MQLLSNKLLNTGIDSDCVICYNEMPRPPTDFCQIYDHYMGEF